MQLTKKQYARISNIFDNIGNVIFGISVISPVTGIIGFDSVNAFVVVLGIVGSLGSWTISILLARKG